MRAENVAQSFSQRLTPFPPRLPRTHDIWCRTSTPQVPVVSTRHERNPPDTTVGCTRWYADRLWLSSKYFVHPARALGGPRQRSSLGPPDIIHTHFTLPSSSRGQAHTCIQTYVPTLLVVRQSRRNRQQCSAESRDDAFRDKMGQKRIPPGDQATVSSVTPPTAGRPTYHTIMAAQYALTKRRATLEAVA